MSIYNIGVCIISYSFALLIAVIISGSLTVDMGPRKERVLTMQQRLDVLKDLQTSPVATIADKYGVHATTIRRVRRNAAFINEFANKDMQQRQRQRIRKPTYAELEQPLLTWFEERKAAGDVLTDGVMLKKARELRDKNIVSYSQFKVSMGWLVHFKRRNSIRLKHQYKRRARAGQEDFDDINSEDITEPEQEEQQQQRINEGEQDETRNYGEKNEANELQEEEEHQPQQHILSQQHQQQLQQQQQPQQQQQHQQHPLLLQQQLLQQQQQLLQQQQQLLQQQQQLLQEQQQQQVINAADHNVMRNDGIQNDAVEEHQENIDEGVEERKKSELTKIFEQLEYYSAKEPAHIKLLVESMKVYFVK